MRFRKIKPTGATMTELEAWLKRAAFEWLVWLFKPEEISHHLLPLHKIKVRMIEHGRKRKI